MKTQEEYAKRMLDLIHEVGDAIDQQHGMDAPGSIAAFDTFIAGSIRQMLLMCSRPRVTLNIGGEEIQVRGSL